MAAAAGVLPRLGEPVVDGLHEPQALVFERNGEAVLAPLEADVLRWLDGYVENRGRSLRIESERGPAGRPISSPARCRSGRSFPSARLELMFAPPESRSRSPIDLSLNARYLPNELALRLVAPPRSGRRPDRSRRSRRRSGCLRPGLSTVPRSPATSFVPAVRQPTAAASGDPRDRRRGRG